MSIPASPMTTKAGDLIIKTTPQPIIASIEDFQVSALYAATNTFFFKDAAETTSRGIEADIRYALTDDIEIGGAMAYLDTSYGDFPGASCSMGNCEEENCSPETSNRNAAGDTLRIAPE